MSTYSNTPERILLAQEGNEEELSSLVNENMALVKSIAKRFLDRGVDFDDLVQIGSIGLIRAIRGYKAEFETALSTYAVPMIAGEIKRFLRDDGIIKVSRDTKRNASLIRRFSNDFEVREGKSPTTEEIKTATGLSDEEIVFALESSLTPAALVWESGDGENFDIGVGVDTMEKDFDRIAVGCAIEKLDKNERKLIMLRYFRNLTQQETASLLGVTQVKVSRDEKKICLKLKALLE